MPRKPADFRISLKKRGGPTRRIELVRQASARGRFVVRKDGRISQELPEANARHRSLIRPCNSGDRRQPCRDRSSLPNSC